MDTAHTLSEDHFINFQLYELNIKRLLSVDN